MDLQAQASCTTWLETATTHKNTTTKAHLLEGFVGNAISNKRREMTALKKRIWVTKCAQEAAHGDKRQRNYA